MIITYIGKQFFKIQQGDLVIACNPLSKESKYSSAVPKFGSNVVLSTINHPDYNGISTVTYGDTEPFFINGPGDYEVQNVFVKGIGTETTIENKKYINTVYSLLLDDIKIVFLGYISSEKISADVKEVIHSADVIFVPIGGNDELDPSAAYKLAQSLESKIIIPMEYGKGSEKDALKIFLKQGGEEGMKPVEKLTLKKKDLLDKTGSIVVLSSTL
ncbi:hypothetical protein COB64_02635 [Candidatus Wolfebacteria bacterium]|nr:MAG: hypothetical protein COB64_02635 [Candidatus Wolfebacteria bacterium]